MPTESDSDRLFSPASLFWQVNREMLLGLAGMRALLMELAHPLIAAGVAGHSDFRKRPFKRLYRTMRLMSCITFGSRNAATRAVQRIGQCHSSVHGELWQPAGCHSLGSTYRANDPQLKLWVLATLIDSSLCVYELFVRPLSPVEKESYYQDSRRMGVLLGIAAVRMPADYCGFAAYLQTMMSGGILAVSAPAREVAAALLAGPLRGRIVRATSFVSIGLLPKDLRVAYGLPWNEASQKQMLRLAAICRRLRPRLPDVLCVNPQALLAEVCSAPKRAGEVIRRASPP
ncbi:MAG TPA: oxygenase MpaB family protein [Terriglobia bacterium]|nr:oxygenase MpaB family protein [Terriglobia bacterium]